MLYQEETFDTAGVVDAHLALVECFEFGFRKNEAILGGVVRNSFAFVEFEDGGGVPEFAVFALAAFVLDRAEVFQGFVKLAGEALAVEA